MVDVEAVVIGAGIVGLAVARALALQGREVLILEAEKKIGSVTSSRNSGVIHAGIYYKKDSLKARCCVEGRHHLYRYIEERRIPFRRCGKIIVATDSAQLEKLQSILSRAEANGVDDLIRLSSDDIRASEPHVKAVAGLLSPSTGIVDVHELMHSYLADAESRGATLALGTPVEGGEIKEDRFVLNAGGAQPLALSCRIVVNAAGFEAQNLSSRFKNLDPQTIPPLKLAKGNYFCLSGAQIFSRLIYPVPEQGGLGVHATLDLAGQVRFGPDVEWVGGVDYRVDPARETRFYEAIRRYWPALPSGALRPDYSGIRSKISAPDGVEADFTIQCKKEHGIPNLVNLYGIESPGLTASLSIADRCVEYIEG
jgi:L-2-hydroxyglutarate oxidase LhgO